MLLTKNGKLVCSSRSYPSVVFICFQKMKMHQEEKSILKTRQLRREQFLILHRLSKSSLSKVLSGIKLHHKRISLQDLEKTQITIESSLKMMNQTGNQLCGGTIKLVILSARTVMKTSMLPSKMDKLPTPSFLLLSQEFNLRMPLINATTSMTSTLLTTSRDC
jgi:hypothetical protein